MRRILSGEGDHKVPSGNYKKLCTNCSHCGNTNLKLQNLQAKMTNKRVIEDFKQRQKFYELSNGGVTVPKGEPPMQS